MCAGVFDVRDSVTTVVSVAVLHICGACWVTGDGRGMRSFGSLTTTHQSCSWRASSYGRMEYINSGIEEGVDAHDALHGYWCVVVAGMHGHILGMCYSSARQQLANAIAQA